MGRELLKKGFLGRLRFLDRAEMRRQTADAFQRLSIGVNVATSSVGALSGGQRQSVAVARAVTWASKIIILDEPTAALATMQTGKVLELVRRIAEAGLTAILISHDLPEVFEGCRSCRGASCRPPSGQVQSGRGNDGRAAGGHDRSTDPGGGLTVGLPMVAETDRDEVDSSLQQRNAGPLWRIGDRLLRHQTGAIRSSLSR